MPNSLASLVQMGASSALRSSALDGMQPTLRHTPPQYLGSTTAVFSPSCAARMAATYPPGPAPRTTTSWWSAMQYLSRTWSSVTRRSHPTNRPPTEDRARITAIGTRGAPTGCGCDAQRTDESAAVPARRQHDAD